MNTIEHQPDPCEWNPHVGRLARVDDIPHGVATVSLGNGEWHLCSSCAALPAFDRFTERKPLASAEASR
jgi:hypothetical protein